MQNLNKLKVYVCSDCGSPDVDYQGWISVNTKEVSPGGEDLDTYYCKSCEHECKIIEAV